MCFLWSTNQTFIYYFDEMGYRPARDCTPSRLSKSTPWTGSSLGQRPSSRTRSRGAPPLLATHVAERDVLFTGQLLLQSYVTEIQYAVTLCSLNAAGAGGYVTRFVASVLFSWALWLVGPLHVDKGGGILIVLLPASNTVGKGNSGASRAI